MCSEPAAAPAPRPAKGLGTWFAVLAIVGITSWTVSVYDAVAEPGADSIRALFMMGIGTWIFAPAAVRSVDRQDLRPRWFWIFGGLVGGVFALVPLWQHGREWKSTRRKVFGWLWFAAAAVLIVGIAAAG